MNGPNALFGLAMLALIAVDMFCLFLSVSLSRSELSMPCDQYELHLQNSVVAPHGNTDAPVANLDRSSSTVLALQHGHANIVLDHKSILHTIDKHADVSQLQVSLIYSSLS